MLLNDVYAIVAFHLSLKILVLNLYVTYSN